MKHDIHDILEFISDLLPGIIYHRNHLRHFRQCLPEVLNLFDNCVIIDADFSENLTVPVKYEPQSMHWAHEQVNIHSGITKVSGEKIYHPYFSDDKSHDVVFTDLVNKEMLTATDVGNADLIIIESDNCSSQYKSAAHFSKLQELSNAYQKPRIWSIAGHGKGEVDHIGGIAKVAIRQEIARGSFFANSDDMVNFLSNKYAEFKDPHYVLKNISINRLMEGRVQDQRNVYKTIDGSNSFQVLVITPNYASFRAAPHLCICQQCKVEYGSCSNFKEYIPVVETLNKITLRSEILPPENTEDEDPSLCDETVLEFAQEGTVCAIPADEKSSETVHFMKIIGQHINSSCSEYLTDDWGETISPGQAYIEGRYYLPKHSRKNDSVYTLDKRKVFFYKESILYPFVQHSPTKDGIIIPNSEKCDIIYFVEFTGMSSL